MSLSLGIDVGTSGVRTAVVDAGGEVVSVARAPHVGKSASKIDARDWWAAVEACLHAQVAELSALGRSGHEVSRIAVDGTSGSMVLTDAALAPVGPALMYNSKGFTEEAARIAAMCPEADHIAQGSNSALARALSLLAAAEGTPAHLLHQADYIAARLIGQGGRSDANNALKTGFDPDGTDWPDWIKALVGESLLPRVDAVGTAWAEIDGALAQSLGLSPHAVVHAGTTDSIAAFLASAPRTPGAAVTSIGSTLAIKVMSTRRVDLPSMGLYSHRLGDVWLIGGASNTGGAVLAHFFSPGELAELSARIDPGRPTGLNYYPLLGPGERFPVNDPGLAPRMEPRPDDDALFLQALFEGIALVEAESYALIEAQGGPRPSQIFTAGGASANPVFTAIREGFLGMALSQAAETEASVGTARLALSAA